MGGVIRFRSGWEQQSLDSSGWLAGSRPAPKQLEWAAQAAVSAPAAVSVPAA